MLPLMAVYGLASPLRSRLGMVAISVSYSSTVGLEAGPFLVVVGKVLTSQKVQPSLWRCSIARLSLTRKSISPGRADPAIPIADLISWQHPRSVVAIAPALTIPIWR